MKNKIYTFDDHLKESLKDKGFREVWKKTKPEYLLAKTLIQKRQEKRMSQRDLAKKLGTSQATISNIETMDANPSFKQLNKIAKALGSELFLSFR